MNDGQVTFPALRDALEDWTREALPLLAKTRPFVSERYCWVESGLNSRTRIYSPTLDWLLLDVAKQGATWERVTASISSETRISSQINRLVGADAMSSSRVDQDSIGRFMVQPFRPVQFGDDCVYPDFDTDVFDKRYARLESFILTKTLDYEATILLVGVDFGFEEIELTPDTRIVRLSDDECWDYGSIGLLRGLAPHFDDYVSPGSPRHALRIRHNMPKRLDGHNEDTWLEASTAWQSRLSNARERLATAVSLIKPTTFRFGGTATKCLTFGLPNTVFPSSYELFHSTVNFSPGEVGDLKMFWQKVDPLPNLHSSLTTALRRLRYASERQRAEDKIIDSMIAAEAILLADKDQSELQYRFSLRGSWYLSEEIGSVRRMEVDFLKTAYNARSIIAHGGTPKSKDLKIAGSMVTLDEFAQHLESRTRLILRRALLRKTGRDVLPRDWDDDLVGRRETPTN